MKIYIHVAKEDWIIDRIASEFSRRWEDYITDDPREADVIWMLSPSPVNALNTPVVVSIQHIDHTKYNPAFYSALNNSTTCFLTPCQKTKEYMQSKDEITKEITVLPYWLNSSLWSFVHKKTARALLNIPSDKFIVGSFQRDTEGSDLESPKLSKGPDRFCDYVEKLKKLGKDVHVLLGGWRRQYVINRLTEKGIPFTYLEKPAISKVNLMYNACDLYVVGSRYEGGPQAILECAATKTPIVSTDVGIANEILHPKCVIDIENTIHFPTPEEVLFAYDKVMERTLDKDLGYIEFFRGLVK